MPFAIPRARAAATPVDVPLPEPGWLEGLGASFRVSQADTMSGGQARADAAYLALQQRLFELGHDPADYVNTLVHDGRINRGLIWNAAMQEQQRGRMTGLPATMEEYERSYLAPANAELERDEATAARASISAQLIGGMGGAMTDELNLYSVFAGPVRAGAGVWGMSKFLGQQALVNMAIEAPQQAAAALERERTGRRALTLNDALTNIGFAGAGAVVLSGAGEVAAAGLRRLGDTAPVQRWAMQREVQSLRFNPAGAAREALEANDPQLSGLTQRELDALLLAEREIAITNGSPFTRTGGGDELNRILVSDAWARAMVANPFNARDPAAPAPPAPAAVPTRVRVDGQRPDYVPSAGAEGRFMQRVRGAESAGDDTARNPRSSATGRYQFTDETWLAYYRRRYGTTGLSREAILARRGEGRLQDQLMRDLTDDNASALRSGGEAVTEGNLYLAHFAGSAGALKVLRADPNADIGAVLGAAVTDANPFLKGKTASWLVRWAAEKMGAPVPRRGGARITFDEGMSGALARNAEERAAIQDALDRAVARADELAEEARNAGRPRDSALDEAEAAGWEPDFVDFDGRLPQLTDAPEGAPAPEIDWLLPELRAVAATPGRSLNAIDELARDLGATPREVRAAFDYMVAQRELRSGRNGTYARRAPERPSFAGDQSLAEFLASKGGVIDTGGDLRAMGGHKWKREKAFRNQLVRKPAPAGQGGMLGGGARPARGMMPDEAFEAAIDAGYFPEYLGGLDQGSDGTYVDKPDINAFFAAIGEELGGNPRYTVDARRKGEFVEAGAADPAAMAEELEYRERLRSEFLDDLEQADPVAFAAMGDDIAELLDDAVLARFDSAIDAWSALEIVSNQRYQDLLARIEGEYGGPVTADEFPGWQSTGPDEWDGWELDIEARGQPDGAGDASEGIPGASGGSGEAGAGNGPTDGAAIARLPEAERTTFIDPDGEAARAQAESLLHDFRATGRSLLDVVEDELRDPGSIEAGRLADIREYLTDLTEPGVAYNEAARLRAVAMLERMPPDTPKGAGDQMDFAAPTPEQARIALERQMEGRKKGAVAQKPPGSDGGLFDSGAQDMPLRLDPDGDETTLGSLLDDLDAEATDLKNIRDCM